MKLKNIFKGNQKSFIIGLSAFLVLGIGLMFSTGGMDGTRLLSQFSGANVTSATAASMWSASPNNPYLASVGNYNTRLDSVIKGTLKKGENLPTTKFQNYLDNLSLGIIAMGNQKEYANNQEIKNIIGYISFELADAKNAFSASNVFLSDYTTMANGALVNSEGTGSLSSSNGTVTSTGSLTSGGTSGGIQANVVIIRAKDANGTSVTSGAAIYCGNPSRNDYTTYSVGAYNGENGVVALSASQQGDCSSKGGQVWLKCTGNATASSPVAMGNTTLTCPGTGAVVSTGATTTPITATTPTERVTLQIMGLGMSSLGYEPVKVGKTISIGYETTGMSYCKGWYSKMGENLGNEVQFYFTDSEGRTGGGNSTNLPKGEFNLKIDYPTHLEFTCWGATSKKATKEIIDFKTKAHDATDTFIDVSKETISAVGETLNVSWQANPGFKYCHLSKTHSVNGVKGDPTVFLEKTIKISDRPTGSVTDTISTAGRYVYVLFCNDNAESTVDLFDSGNMITSKAVMLAGAATTVAADKNTNGVLYSDIQAFVTGVVEDTSISEPARAQKLYNQMTVSNVSAADIVVAFKNSPTPFTLSDVNTYLDKRNTPVATPVVAVVPVTPVVVTPVVAPVSDANASGVPYESIRSAILGVLGDTSITEAVQAQKIYDAMQSNNVSIADVVFAFKNTATPLTQETISTFLAKRSN